MQRNRGRRGRGEGIHSQLRPELHQHSRKRYVHYHSHVEDLHPDTALPVVDIGDVLCITGSMGVGRMADNHLIHNKRRNIHYLVLT
mmetsp:Transcript_10885/g.11686  ORF Transcript_10885/g.11686 Transcript_10885/m.11686 type:complete len:86 (+) Transcript_10885:302-559(+)